MFRSCHSSTIFAVLTHEGSVFVFDIFLNKYSPICKQVDSLFVYLIGHKTHLIHKERTINTKKETHSSCRGLWLQMTEYQIIWHLMSSNPSLLSVIARQESKRRSYGTLIYCYNIMQGRVFSLKLSPNLRMRTKKEENALQEDNLKLFNNLNLYKIQKVLSNIVKLPDFVNVPITPKS